ncbi:cytosine permease [Bradyrhizobium prioriisuperbiae]|uniref:purine-cytosine permease family protein n=1 Tax=Bradyrhizobium prioriisuperbiae TaxID=2854389 RepID=UPI0028E8F892|nr:cytosine permease [Bradyrhizobium prioritasuperba]
MTDIKTGIANPGQSQAGFDAHGITPVPAAHRTSSPFDQFWIWTGANVAPINWVLGALGIQLGLSLLQVLAVVVVGNLLGAALFGAVCLMGHRTGAPQMVLARLAFGRHGAYLPALAQVLMPMGWVAVNTWIVLDLCVAALERMGFSGGPELKYLIAAVVMVLQIAIAAWGFNTIKVFERYTMPVILAIMAIMTALAFIRVDIQWQTSTTSGLKTFAAASQLMTAIGIGWGISWLVYASDYTRFTRPGLRAGQVFRATFLGMFLPTVWLACLGAAIASGGAGSDPSQLIIAAFGVMAMPVLLVLVHGPIATNIVVIYSAALSSLALDIRWPRWTVSVISGLIASVILYFFLRSGDFAHAFDNFMVALVVWISPWAGVTLTDFFLVRGGRVDVAELYAPGHSSRYGDVNWAGLIALGIGLMAAWVFQMGSIPAMQGPLALMTGGIDLSWLTGMVVAGASYLVLHPLCGRAVADADRRPTFSELSGEAGSTTP